MSTTTFLDILKGECAKFQSLHPERTDEISRAQAMIIAGGVLETDDGNGQVCSRDGATWYTVNSHCDCQAASYGKPCRHLAAWKLFQHVQKKVRGQAMLEAPATREELPLPAPEPPAGPQMPTAVAATLPEAPASIDPKFIIRMHGKPFVRYAGLLALAHQRGLQELRVAWTYNDADLSLAEATAVFPFGTYQEAGDASPSNVKKEIAPSFRRMALTRAAARVLRNALAIEACSVEELPDHD